jgi:hypothetical protein
MEKLLDSNFVYFAIYFTFMASIGQYVIWKKISTFCHNVHSAFCKAKVTLAKREKATAVKSRDVKTVDVPAVELVARPDLQFKVNQKAVQKHLELIKQQREVDAGMHNLTSKFHKKAKA